MNLLVVSGSQRIGSQSAKVAEFISDKSTGYSQVNHIELCLHQLPFWDGEKVTKQEKGSDWPIIERKIRSADSIVLITPEWGGMASPLLKNFLLMCEQKYTAHKPVLLVSVVSGINGAYPIAELRMNALKNNKLVAVPDHLIIRNVETVLNKGDDSESLEMRDISLRQRIEYSLHMLFQYATVLNGLRIQQKIRPYPNQEEYSYAM